jgi:peptidoglycan/LPS O-acetylase OafA/YrhL
MQIKSIERIGFLDGLRGIAILLVVLYHTYSNAWKDLVPFFAPSFDFPLVKFGDLGVPLFFMISGFVIAMSLERCKSFSEFMFKRWLRLFPGMLIATLLILLTAHFFSYRPLGDVRLISAISGLTFISPTFFDWIFHQNQGMLEGGFWSLFVEVKFYIVAGLIYFKCGQKKMINALLIMFLIYTVYDVLKAYLGTDMPIILEKILNSLDFKYCGWFASGALFYRYFMTKDHASFILGVFIALLSARNWGGLMSSTMMAFVVIIGVFASAMFSRKLQELLSNKLLTFFGYISYPLYLIHENATISIIVQLHQRFNEVNPYVLSLIPLSIMIVIAWIIAKYLEPLLKNWLKAILN